MNILFALKRRLLFALLTIIVYISSKIWMTIRVVYMGKGFSFLASVLFLIQGVSAQEWYARENSVGAHDPTVLRHEDGYVLQTTNNMLLTSTSEDALYWKTHGRALSAIPSWLKTVTNNGVEDIWAPDLFFFGGEYRSYYTGSAFGKNTSGIGFVSTKSIVPGSSEYNWVDEGEVVRSVSSNNYNAIDADVVEDADGNYWMAFGSWWTGIKLVRLDESTGKQSSSDKTVYSIANRGGSGIEGPSIIEHKGKYFLFTAWDVCCKMGADLEDNTYKTVMGRADNITGPYVDRSGKSLANGGGTILMQRYGRYYGPGGGEAFKDLNRIRFAHHYYNANSNGSPTLHIRDVVFTEDNWAEMGQPFLGRYLSAEAEHGALTNVEITTGTASNGEYVAYINYADSKVRLPMNIPQSGEYLLRYRYANGDANASTHQVTINGQKQTVNLPSTGAWGTFPENSVVYIPATLKRGGNFIEVGVGTNFGELDRIDFLRVIRDTLPANGFDNGIRVRLNDNDEFAIKAGGWALFENVITDSIKGNEVSIQVKNSSGGTLTLHAGSRTSAAISTCTLPSSTSEWTKVECSSLSDLSGVKDFYIKAEGLSQEVLVGNISFEEDGPPISLMKQKTPGLNYQLTKTGPNYTVVFDEPGAYTIDVFNSLGQVLKRVSTSNEKSIELSNLPETKTIIRVQKLGRVK